MDRNSLLGDEVPQLLIAVVQAARRLVARLKTNFMSGAAYSDMNESLSGNKVKTEEDIYTLMSCITICVRARFLILTTYVTLILLRTRNHVVS